jgi:GGDEF domain-containing protein
MAIAAWVAPPLPDSLEGLLVVGPYAMLAVATGVAMWFNRGRAFVVGLSLLAAFYALQNFGNPEVRVRVAIGVPLNALIALAAPERGARFGQAWQWVALLVMEAILVVIVRGKVPLDHFLFHFPPMPLAARLAFAGAIAAAVARGWPHFTPLEVGIPGALVAFYIAWEWTGTAAHAYLMAGAGLVLLVTVLHESHRMAFRDTLTGLPNRRALDEQMRALGSKYAIAMADVDHFKSFNDKHGHDIGDHVLRLVATRLAELQGDGRAFRYGGEEFTVLFPGQTLEEAMPQLEAMRAAVEAYPMRIRGEDRPRDKGEGEKRRAASSPGVEKALWVTISIGAAEPGEKRGRAADVLKAADEALYRAKKAGRNRVSS